MANIEQKDIVTVVEKQEVTYQKHQFLFFEWLKRIKTTGKDRAIYISTNDRTITQVIIHRGAENYQIDLTNTTN